MTIGVTGATGHLGRLVLDKLKAKAGEAIVALVRSPTNAGGLGVAVREADYAKPATLNRRSRGSMCCFSSLLAKFASGPRNTTM